MNPSPTGERSPTVRSSSAGRAAKAVLATGAIAVALFAFSFDSNAAIANYDGIWYAIHAEAGNAGGILAHHILFHAIVFGATWVLDAAGVAHPGSVACRFVAGLGAAALLLLVAGRSGRRWGIGCLFALVLFACRSIIIEAGVGENVLPATAAGLFAIIIATRRAPSLAATGVTLAIALLLRQDNVLLVPAIAFALARGLPPRRRIVRIMIMIGIAGGVAAAASLVAWRFAAPGVDFGAYMFQLGLVDWYVPVAGARIGAHADALGVAAVGRHWAPSDHQLWIGAGLLAAIASASFLLRGDRPQLRFVAVSLLAIVVRVPFFTWFEPHNPEWHVMTLGLLAACGSAACRGAPRTQPVARAAGVLLLLALAGAIFAAHISYTVKLHDRSFTEAVQALGDTSRYEAFVESHHVGAVFHLLGLPYHAFTPTDGDPTDILLREAVARPRPMMYVFDRFVLDGMPYSLNRLSAYHRHYDVLESTRELEPVPWHGRVYALKFDPTGVARPQK